LKKLTTLFTALLALTLSVSAAEVTIFASSGTLARQVEAGAGGYFLRR